MRRFAFGLDLGHFEWKISALEELPDGNVVFFNQAIKNEHLRGGEIIDQENFELQLKMVFENLIESLNAAPFHDLVLAVSFPQTQTYFQKGYVIIEDYVSDEDINKALRMTKTSINLANQEVLLEKPYRFVLDNDQEVRDPKGMSGRRLDIEAILLTVHRSHLEKLRQAFKNIGINLSAIIPSAYAKSLICLDKRDKEIGVGLLDIGSETTSLLVFINGNLVTVKIFPFGGQNLTEDLAVYYKLDLDEAEELKQRIYQESGEKKIARIKVEKNVFSKALVLRFVEKCLKRYFEDSGLLNFLKETRKKYKLPSGIVLCGGFSTANGITTLMKRLLDIPVKVAKNETNVFQLSESNEEFLKYAGSLSCAYLSLQQTNRGHFWLKLRNLFRNLIG